MRPAALAALKPFSAAPVDEIEAIVAARSTSLGGVANAGQLDIARSVAGRGAAVGLVGSVKERPSRFSDVAAQRWYAAEDS